ncbi:RsmD family RNA methyltransferase [Cutibacterium equinum]|uniref:RsmD family RNA methyltransferase n=1 Tax=Cutibacterium equinum TaxID=3016342 RepID=A0ABY7R1K9_9ACTN|nr:RsmD family RNA methyltransferase [Cutibacterium equinum]WCC81121.1 RsmD family RNA methyltransferase [Cutibacterium equinum]
MATPSGRLTRPTTDRVREAVFSALAAWNATADEAPEDQLAGQAFCDLFAGSGAVALEAASRGASPVVAVDRDRAACTVMKENSRATRLAIEVAPQPVSAFLGETRQTFDIVWFDPPYDVDDEVVDSLISSATHSALADDGVVVVERSRRSRAPRFPEGFESWDSRYGETVVYYAQRNREPVEQQ